MNEQVKKEYHLARNVYTRMKRSKRQSFYERKSEEDVERNKVGHA
jgi:hypothetical protein